MPEIKVAVLLDPNNNWIDKYIRQIEKIDNLKERYCFYFSDNPEAIKNFDIVFILGYTKILKKPFLELNGLNLVVHESNLPEGKGFSPVQWQVLEGRNLITVCLLEAIEKVDSGDILEKDLIELNGHELFEEIRKKQAFATIELIRRFLDKYPNITRTKQIGRETFCSQRTVKDDELDVNKTLRELFNHFRIAQNEEHPLFFIIGEHKYYLKVYKDK